MIAYFSMEIGLDAAISTYSGGLGVLAGDTLRAAADLELPVVAVTLAHRCGYFRQELDPDGAQHEWPAPWEPEARCQALAPRVQLDLAGRSVTIRAWQWDVVGAAGHVVPVYLLDTSLDENAPEDRELTDRLYGEGGTYRLRQEAVLGLGGLALLHALGHDVATFHMNEGHASLLALGLLERDGAPVDEALERVRAQCVFTTHTPVPAGHDRFPLALVRDVLGDARVAVLSEVGCCTDATLNMTCLALYFAGFINGVAMRHGQISREMFPGRPIAAITNGVHAATWVAPPVAAMFDRHLPDWRQQNSNLRHAVGLPLLELQEAHRQAKHVLVDMVAQRSGVQLRPDVFTLGFARRATAYKRADLLLSDVERLRALAADGGLQIVYGGKAHPNDGGGKELIRRVFARIAELRGIVPIVYLEEYDMAIAQWLCAGVDLWVNTPQPPLEASGTSGMKAALNGVPSLSVLDGWWIEGHIEGVTGWSIGDGWDVAEDPVEERRQLYDKLDAIAAVFRHHPEDYARIMRYAVAINGSFFNAQRMVQQYAERAYGNGSRPAVRVAPRRIGAPAG